MKKTIQFLFVLVLLTGCTSINSPKAPFNPVRTIGAFSVEYDVGRTAQRVTVDFDLYYTLVPLDWFKKFRAPVGPWKQNVHDCDKIAREAQIAIQRCFIAAEYTPAVFMMLVTAGPNYPGLSNGTKHAVLLVYCDDGRHYLYDPQLNWATDYELAFQTSVITYVRLVTL